MKHFLSIVTFIILNGYSLNIPCQINTVWGPDGYITIQEAQGGFFADLDPGDRFGRDHDAIGDVNGDGTIDMVVGARSDDDGAEDAGAVYILFMNSDGTVLSNQKISMLEGNFSDSLTTGNFFGYGVAGIGDYDNDDVPDIAVSAPVPPNRCIYIIHLNSNGTVKSFVKNANITAQGLSAIGDLNGDGRTDLAACDPGSDIGGTDIGAVRLIFFNTNSMLIPQSTIIIGPQNGGFLGELDSLSQFGGREAAMLGDIDGDGTKELAVGAFMSHGGKGAIWILSLDPTTHHVVSQLEISEGINGFNDTLTAGPNPNGTLGANFGHALCSAGDLNGDGITDLISGANQQNEGWGYILYLNPDKSIKSYTRINNESGGFNLSLESEERFSRSISFLGDLRNNGTLAVNIGGGAGGTGTLYLLFFKPCQFQTIANFNHWQGGNTQYTNWDEQSQSWVDQPLSFEQCSFKAFEFESYHLSFNATSGKCICYDEFASGIWDGSEDIALTNDCIIPMNIEDPTSKVPFQIFPNPVGSILNIQFDQSTNLSQAFFELINLQGEKIQKWGNIHPSNTLDTSDIPAGNYILVFHGLIEHYHFLIIKE